MLLTTNEVATVLRVHPKHVYRLLKQGLPARRVGSEWRFDEAEVLAWAGGARSEEPRGAPVEHAPPLVAANGDVAVEVLLEGLGRAKAPLLGFVQADQGAGMALLRDRKVLATGAHGEKPPGGEGRLVRLHLTEREVGLAFRKGLRVRRASSIVGRRFASRPPTAGIRAHLDAALRSEDVDPSGIDAEVCASHRDAVIAVASGRAEIGLASRAWAARMGLGFFPLAAEAYGFLLRAEDLSHPAVLALCDLAQSGAFRQRLRSAEGYDPRKAGELLFPSGLSRAG